MNTRETLERARALIADEGKWCKVVLARNGAQHETLPLDPAAVQWCALGALQRTVGGFADGYATEREALDRAASKTSDYKTIVSLNDEGTHADVMRAYDVAIADAFRMEENA